MEGENYGLVGKLSDINAGISWGWERKRDMLMPHGTDPGVLARAWRPRFDLSL